MRSELAPIDRRSTGLVDVLDRVLDKGLVVAGDIRVSLAEVELLTIRIRLIVCSLDKAEEIGLDWWRYDRYLTMGHARERTEKRLRATRARTTTQATVTRRRARTAGGSRKKKR